MPGPKDEQTPLGGGGAPLVQVLPYQAQSTFMAPRPPPPCFGNETSKKRQSKIVPWCPPSPPLSALIYPNSTPRHLTRSPYRICPAVSYLPLPPPPSCKLAGWESLTSLIQVSLTCLTGQRRPGLNGPSFYWRINLVWGAARQRPPPLPEMEMADKVEGATGASASQALTRWTSSLTAPLKTTTTTTTTEEEEIAANISQVCREKEAAQVQTRQRR